MVLLLLLELESAPSAEQIKKIYDDEKVLFQENAKATLYGSSNAVTALGYDEDTELYMLELLLDVVTSRDYVE